MYSPISSYFMAFYISALNELYKNIVVFPLNSDLTHLPWLQSCPSLDSYKILKMGDNTVRCRSDMYGHFSTKSYHEGERERLSLLAFLGTEDIRVHIVHISHVIITYTLE